MVRSLKMNGLLPVRPDIGKRDHYETRLPKHGSPGRNPRNAG